MVIPAARILAPTLGWSLAWRNISPMYLSTSSGLLKYPTTVPFRWLTGRNLREGAARGNRTSGQPLSPSGQAAARRPDGSSASGLAGCLLQLARQGTHGPTGDPHQFAGDDREHVGPGAGGGPHLVVAEEVLVDIDRQV